MVTDMYAQGGSDTETSEDSFDDSETDRIFSGEGRPLIDSVVHSSASGNPTIPVTSSTQQQEEEEETVKEETTDPTQLEKG